MDRPIKKKKNLLTDDTREFYLIIKRYTIFTDLSKVVNKVVLFYQKRKKEGCFVYISIKY